MSEMVIAAVAVGDSIELKAVYQPSLDEVLDDIPIFNDMNLAYAEVTAESSSDSGAQPLVEELERLVTCGLLSEWMQSRVATVVDGLIQEIDDDIRLSR